MDPLLAEVFEDLMKVSKLTAMNADEVAQAVEGDEDLADRLEFARKHLVSQRKATLEEVSEYLALMGINSKAGKQHFSLIECCT